MAAAESSPQPASPTCTEGQTNALSEIACELRQQVAITRPTLVVSQGVAADAPVSDQSRLAGRIASVIAGGLGGLAHAHPVAAQLGAAQLAAAKQGALLFLEPRINSGQLEVVANLYPIARSFWDRVRAPHPSPMAHAFAKRPLDPELRSFFAPIPLVAKRTTQASPPELAPVALACGDADGDGSDEIAFIGRRRVALGRIRQGRFTALAEKAWAELSPIATAPLKEPIAAVRFRTSGSIDVGSSDRARFLRLDQRLAIVNSDNRKIPIGSGCLSLEGVQLGSTPIACLPDDPAPRLVHSAPADIVVDSSILGVNGTRSTYVARYVARDNQITLQTAGRSLATLDDAGAQLALADLDGDGLPELLSSLATLHPKDDALLVHSLSKDGRLIERLRLAMPDGVTALGVCRPDTTQMAAILVGTGARLWIVQ